MAQNKIKAGEAYVEATLDDGSLRSKLKRLGRFFERTFPKSTKVASNAVKAFGAVVGTTMTVATGGVALLAAGLAALGGAAVGGIGYATNKFLELSEEISKTAAKAGIGVEAMSELDYAAKQFGATGEDVSEALLEMRRRIAEGMSDNSGPAINGLRILGLELEKIAAMRPEQQLEAIATAMKNLGNNDLAAFAADELFGSDAEKFIPLLMKGADGIRELRKEARELGVVIEGEDVEAAGKLSRAFATLKAQWDSVMVKVGAAFAPILNRAAEVIQEHLQPALKQVESVLEGIEEHFEWLVDQPDKLGESFKQMFDVVKGYLKEAAFDFAGHVVMALHNIFQKIGRGDSFFAGAARDVAGALIESRVDLDKAAFEARENREEAFGRKIFDPIPVVPVEASRPERAGAWFTPKRIPNILDESFRIEPPVIPESIASAGTFSGRAASFLGGGSDPVVTELKDANKSLVKIERAVRDSGTTFS